MGYDIDPTIPADDDIVSQHPTGARAFRQTVQDLLSGDHDEGASGSPYHKKVTLKEQSADPTVSANQIGLYAKEAASKCNLFLKDEDGNVQQVTENGKIIFAALAALILENNVALQGKDTPGGAAQDLIKIDGSNIVTVGDSGQPLTVLVDALANLKASAGTPYKLLTEADEGSGNGLDADTLDGEEGADHVRWIGGEFYDSGEQTMGWTGKIMSHGLGAVPRLFQVYLVSKSSQYGFSDGDVIAVNGPGAYNDKAVTWVSASQIGWEPDQAGPFYLTRKDGTGYVNIYGETDWRLIFRAWK